MTTHTDHQELIVYTDWHGVTITDCHFYTKDQTYMLEGIRDARLIRKKGSLWPVFFLFLAGVAGILTGAAQVFPANGAGTSAPMDPNLLLLIGGLVLLVSSGIIYVTAPGKYAVVIRTAEGLNEAAKSLGRKNAEHLVWLLKSASRENVGTKKEPVIPVKKQREYF